MPITIQYCSHRRDVWAHYVRFWQQRLWRIHAALFTAIALGLLVGLQGWHLSPAMIAAISIAGGLLPCAALALYPLVKFKPQTRILIIDGNGLRTSIGEMYGEVGWREVAAIGDHEGLIIIRRTNGNAFLIPERAFASPADRRIFLTAARDAWSAFRR